LLFKSRGLTLASFFNSPEASSFRTSVRVDAQDPDADIGVSSAESSQTSCYRLLYCTAALDGRFFVLHSELIFQFECTFSRFYSHSTHFFFPKLQFYLIFVALIRSCSWPAARTCIYRAPRGQFGTLPAASC
jgi:hypothetical protein